MKKKIIELASKLLPVACACLVVATLLDYTIIKVTLFVLDPANINKLGPMAEVNTSALKHYHYNDQIPVEVIKAEITKQATVFGNNPSFMLNLAECESTFDNLADNPKSTGKGVYQFVALTWETTESNKQHISEFDYIANIREANIKIANGEYSHWTECLSKIGK